MTIINSVEGKLLILFIVITCFTKEAHSPKVKAFKMYFLC